MRIQDLKIGSKIRFDGSREHFKTTKDLGMNLLTLPNSVWTVNEIHNKRGKGYIMVYWKFTRMSFPVRDLMFAEKASEDEARLFG